MVPSNNLWTVPKVSARSPAARRLIPVDLVVEPQVLHVDEAEARAVPGLAPAAGSVHLSQMSRVDFLSLMFWRQCYIYVSVLQQV